MCQVQGPAQRPPAAELQTAEASSSGSTSVPGGSFDPCVNDVGMNQGGEWRSTRNDHCEYPSGGGAHVDD